jgi:hypothetical protein
VLLSRARQWEGWDCPQLCSYLLKKFGVFYFVGVESFGSSDFEVSGVFLDR